MLPANRYYYYYYYYYYHYYIIICSFVWKMPSPCNTDLRWRIIWLVLGMRKPAREVAELLGVRTIFNILCGFRRNGNVRPCRIGRPNVMASIARDEAFLLMEYIMHHPGAYLREAVHYLENSCGRELSLSSVRRCLARRDFTRKQVRQR